jgi:hypothetical protein
MEKMNATSGPAKALEIEPDAWERFKRAVSVVVRTPPQHRARARVAAGRVGHRSKLSSFQRAEAIKRCEAGEPQNAIARMYGVDQSTISRLFRARSAKSVSQNLMVA